jgi:putative transposase
MPLQGSLSIERMCQLVPVSRRSFYRSLKEQQPAEEELEVRSAIQQIALEHRRRYGYRRITAELHRRGMQITRKSSVTPEGNHLFTLGTAVSQTDRM